MKYRRALLWICTVLVTAAIAVAVARTSPDQRKRMWQSSVSPGQISEAHTRIENDCAACHTPYKGVEAANCIVCHANNRSLLQRQPTAFHASISTCRECHVEHRGRESNLTQMDHVTLARIARLEQIGSERKAQASPTTTAVIAEWLESNSQSRASIPHFPNVTAAESRLNCAACHSNQDIHRAYFGNDCARCHATSSWQIAEFKHPSSTSRDCAQCHQAPPSHYMMHFEMVSMKVAGQHHANVNQCFLCHQTTSWNDIQGVGWYKHH